jgi:hypothetical protein
MGPMAVTSRCRDGGCHAEGIAVCPVAQRGSPAAQLPYAGRPRWPSPLSTRCAGGTPWYPPGQSSSDAESTIAKHHQ